MHFDKLTSTRSTKFPWNSFQHIGSRTGLVMQIVYSRRPAALASPSRACALTRATISRSQADPVLFLLTKPVLEPTILSDRNHIILS